jgi:hypothetical protein
MRETNLANEEHTTPIDLVRVESEALKRLIAEVRRKEPGEIGATAYNRTYHRHNR